MFSAQRFAILAMFFVCWIFNIFIVGGQTFFLCVWRGFQLFNFFLRSKKKYGWGVGPRASRKLDKILFIKPLINICVKPYLLLPPLRPLRRQPCQDAYSLLSRWGRRPQGAAWMQTIMSKKCFKKIVEQIFFFLMLTTEYAFVLCNLIFFTSTQKGRRPNICKLLTVCPFSVKFWPLLMIFSLAF